MAIIAAASRPLNRSRLICRGVLCSSVPFIMEAILPISVSIPVAVTTATPRPPVTREPENTMFTRSASGTSSAGPPLSTAPRPFRRVFPKTVSCLSTFSDSPVRELSLTCRPYTSIRRASAATKSPASSSRISPGTTWEEGMSACLPSRRTRASGEDRDFRLSRDFSAFWCCTVPNTAFSSSTAKITPALPGSPVTMEIPAATIRIMTSRSLNCSRNTCHHCLRPASSITFSPYCFSRSFASRLSNPCPPVVSCDIVSCFDSLNQSAMSVSPFLLFSRKY